MKEKEFYRLWEENSLLYGKNHLRIHHEPYLISSEQSSFFRKSVEFLQGLIEKVTGLFINEKFRDILKFDPRLLDLILADPGYSMACPIGRWDSFFDGKNLQFLELNTDGTSGMAYVEELDSLYQKKFPSNKKSYPCEFKKKVLDVLLNCFQECRQRRVEKPQIAIVDWENVSTRPEQEVLSFYFQNQGYSSILADPRSLSYDGHILSKEGFRIDLIYRRVVTGEYLEAWSEVKAMTRAYLDQNVCMMGSLRSQIGFDKRTLAILSDPMFDTYFTSEERALCARHIPWTRVLKEGETVFRGERFSIPENLVKNQSLFILKPSDLNRGRGIVFGSQVSAVKWEKEVKRGLGRNYVVQEQLPMPRWKDDWGFHLGHFVFGGKLSGWMCRISHDFILGDTSDERLIPCLSTKRKE
ncbi:MAG: hypothetical protein HYS08_07595 [Chlamydiae bacterium]|nr:hypothetical protein [Chlamydiota bacterium]MBI3266359.1 hypothetical protein [Chlamydiota bacterium]